MPRRVRNWKRLVAEFESSGLSRAEFCRRRNVNYQTMTGWVKRLAPGGVEVKRLARSGAAVKRIDRGDRVDGKERSLHGLRSSSFVELAATSAITSTAYEVMLGEGRSIRLEGGFDDEVLARLIKVVASC